MEVLWWLHKIYLAVGVLRQSNRQFTMAITGFNEFHKPQTHTMHNGSKRILCQVREMYSALSVGNNTVRLPVVCRSSSHKLMWGNCSSCFHFLLFPFLFPPPPVKQKAWFEKEGCLLCDKNNTLRMKVISALKHNMASEWTFSWCLDKHV